MLLKDYDIRNAVFFDNEIYREFEKSSKTIIQKLRKQENKQCISDEKSSIPMLYQKYAQIAT